jgi:ATP synthase protein I
MNRWRLRGSTASALVGAQVLTAAVAASIAWIGWGGQAAVAAAYGGLAVILPTMYFAVKVRLRSGVATAAEVLGAFYKAEAVKLVLTAVMFWIGAKLFGQHFAPLMLTCIACLAMNWIMVALTRDMR